MARNASNGSFRNATGRFERQHDEKKLSNDGKIDKQKPKTNARRDARSVEHTNAIFRPTALANNTSASTPRAEFHC